MDLRSPSAFYGLVAKSTGTRHGVTWSPRLGVPATTLEFPDSDVLFSFLLSGVTDTINPVLALATGVITADGATVDGGTNDFESVALPAIASIQSVIFERLDSYPGPVIVESDADTPGAWHVGPLEIVPLISPTALFTDPTADAANLSFRATASNPPQPIRLLVTVLGTAA
jgi:hypothetical protein